MALAHESVRLRRALDSARFAEAKLGELGTGFEEPRQELLKSIESASAERVRIAIVGSAKRGKSTLINGLLGRRDDMLAPVGRFPATNVASVFSFSPTLSVRVCFQDGSPERRITEQEIRNYACEDRNKANHKGVSTIQVEGPFAGLDRRVVLADLPGSDNVQAVQHGQVLYDFLPAADAVIFVLAADAPINAHERALLQHIHGLGLKSVFFVVNKVDYVRIGELDADHLSDGIEHNRNIIRSVGFEDPLIHAVSAKDYLEGRDHSGVEGLVQEMQSMLEHGRLDLIAARLEDRTRALLESLLELTKGEQQLARSTVEDLEHERLEIAKLSRSLTSGRGAREAQFTRHWDAALHDCVSAIRKAEKRLGSEYEALIQGTSGSEIVPLMKTIHSDVHVALCEAIKPELEKCSERLNAARRDLTGSLDLTSIKFTELVTPVQQAASILAGMSGTLRVAASAAPGLAAGAAILVAPGAVGAAIASAAPAVAAATWNPLTWGPAVVSSAGATAVGGAQTVAVTALGTIAAPLTAAACLYAVFQAFKTWRAVRAQERNELQMTVTRMLEDACSNTCDAITAMQGKASEVLSRFHEHVEQQLKFADERLEELIRTRPSETQLREFERREAVLVELVRLQSTKATPRILPPPMDQPR